MWGKIRLSGFQILTAMTELPDPPWEIHVPLRKFLTIPDCPPRWKAYNLYLFRDDETVFYVGQSYCAFERVWEHIRGGPHGHAIVGRFVLANWPRSGRFTIELLNALGPRFDTVAHNLDAAERQLIEQFTPCFNVSLNAQPAPLPPGYLAPNANIKYLKNYKRMLREASYAAHKDSSDLEWN
jgi:hypothetical protein